MRNSARTTGCGIQSEKEAKHIKKIEGAGTQSCRTSLHRNEGHPSSSKKVAVIGAGAAGLVTAHCLFQRQEKFDITIFEQTLHVGGTWVYTETIGTDEYGLPVHSSMYKSLRTNLPKELMFFPGFPHLHELPSFITHQDVRCYLERFSESLLHLIKFKHVVQLVRPIVCSETDAVKWEITVRNLSDGCLTVENFDAVIVCNGHYSEPYIPESLLISNFDGLVMHSHDYRTRDVFDKKTVIVLGGRSSALDISIEICPIANKVYLCHRNSFSQSSLPENIIQKCCIQHMIPDGAVLVTGEIIKADVLLLCTGYLYSYPFLSKFCQLEVTVDNVVTPLYRHLVHARYPTMAFIGIPKLVNVFHVLYCQARYVAALLEDCLQSPLPSCDEMINEANRNYTEHLQAGKSLRHFHEMNLEQWTYCNQLAADAGFEPLPPVMKQLFEHLHSIRQHNFVSYKDENYTIIDDNSFIKSF